MTPVSETDAYMSGHHHEGNSSGSPNYGSRSPAHVTRKERDGDDGRGSPIPFIP